MALHTASHTLLFEASASLNHHFPFYSQLIILSEVLPPQSSKGCDQVHRRP